MGRSRSGSYESSRSRSSRDKHDRKKSRKKEEDKRKKKHEEYHDTGMASDASAPSLPKNPSNANIGDVFALLQSLNKKVDKIDALSDQLSELAVNQKNTTAQIKGVENRLDGLDARIIKLEAAPASSSNDPLPPEYGPAPTPHVWGSRERGTFVAPRPQATLPFEGFDRAHRPYCLSCNAHDNVKFAKSTAKEFFVKLLESKGLKVEFDIDGQFELGKKFRLTFQGPGSVPIETVQCLLRARKGSDGKWLHFTIKDPDGTDVKFYWDEDKSPKSIKRETITNKFCNMLRERYGQDDPEGKSRFLARKEEGKISLKGGTLCSINVSSDNADLQWNLNADFEGSGIDKVAMSEAFKKKFCIQWSP